MDLLSVTPGFIDLTNWGEPDNKISIRSSAVQVIRPHDRGCRVYTSREEYHNVQESREDILTAIALDNGRVEAAKGNNPFNVES